jgi:hypothetical protein
MVAEILKPWNTTVEAKDADYYTKYTNLKVGDRKQSTVLQSKLGELYTLLPFIV